MIVKYVFVSGGVVSSLGKGLSASAIGALFESRGLPTLMLKMDPYLNPDCGSMNPYEHGECFVTEDGAETDLDLGHYSRFTSGPITQLNNVTSGQVYKAVIDAERRGDFLGQTVQVVPHITKEIQRRIAAAADVLERSSMTAAFGILIVEIGGTVGSDIESLPFLEAARQFIDARPASDCANVHVTYVPFLKAAGELKTKPTQHSVQTLRGLGLVPQIILARCENSLPPNVKDKIAFSCSVAPSMVVDVPDMPTTIYELPLWLHSQGVDSKILQKLDVSTENINLVPWQRIVDVFRCNDAPRIRVALVGKYATHADAYKSVVEALRHGAFAWRGHIEILPIESDQLETCSETEFEHHFLQLTGGPVHGVLVPGGFGSRGIDGKLRVIHWCRTQSVPLFGICLGLQMIVVEHCRNVLGFTDAHSTEMSPETPYPVIALLSEQKGLKELGGTMRKGAFDCELVRGSRTYHAYGECPLARERHRHRWEINHEFVHQMETSGLTPVGWYRPIGSSGKPAICEIMESSEHPFLVGVQFHPEFKSKVLSPHPLFKAFCKAMFDKAGCVVSPLEF